MEGWRLMPRRGRLGAPHPARYSSPPTRHGRRRGFDNRWSAINESFDGEQPSRRGDESRAEVRRHNVQPAGSPLGRDGPETTPRDGSASAQRQRRIAAAQPAPSHGARLFPERAIFRDISQRRPVRIAHGVQKGDYDTRRSGSLARKPGFSPGRKCGSKIPKWTAVTSAALVAEYEPAEARRPASALGRRDLPPPRPCVPCRRGRGRRWTRCLPRRTPGSADVAGALFGDARPSRERTEWQERRAGPSAPSSTSAARDYRQLAANGVISHQARYIAPGDHPR